LKHPVARTKITQLGATDGAAVIGAADLFDEPPNPAAVTDYLRDERNVFLLASEGARAVGFLRGTGLVQLKNERKQMFLYEIAVAEEFRRRGIGRQLIERLLEYCRLRGFEEVFVFTDPGNEAAVQMYRSTGGATETPADRMFVYRL
jgi:ribosomal protein S18 acetylase RimI-like enzyme